MENPHTRSAAETPRMQSTSTVGSPDSTSNGDTIHVMSTNPRNGGSGEGHTGTVTQNSQSNDAPTRSATTDEAELGKRSYDMIGHLKVDRRIRLLDVVTMNVNSMIGTGIFTTPGMILALTRSKTMALTFWLAGPIYSLLG